MENVEAVLAINRRRVLADRGRIPWHAPHDMAHFRRLTVGQVAVMGRRTFDAIGRALPERENVVLSRRSAGVAVAGVTVLPGWDEVVSRYADGPRRIVVIGGAEVFALALADIARVHLTVVDDDQAGDVVLPPFEHLFRETELVDLTPPGNPRLVYKTLERLF